MVTEQDKRIIRTMASTLQVYLEHNYPIEYRHENHGKYSFSMLILTSPRAGQIMLTKMTTDNGFTALYRMDHAHMATPEDIVANFQEQFRNMYISAAIQLAKHGSQDNIAEV